MKPHYIVWTDYGLDGWKPTYCHTTDEVLQALRTSGVNTVIVTTPVEVTLEIGRKS